MGNCCQGGPSSMVWARDDWYESIPRADDRVGMKKANPGRPGTRAPTGKEGGFSHPCSWSSTSSNRTVKIEMREEELEKLLKEADVKGMSPEQVMAVARLVSGRGGYSVSSSGRLRPWRPALQSIPEID